MGWHEYQLHMECQPHTEKCVVLHFLVCTFLFLGARGIKATFLSHKPLDNSALIFFFSHFCKEEKVMFMVVGCGLVCVPCLFFCTTYFCSNIAPVVLEKFCSTTERETPGLPLFSNLVKGVST